MARSKLIYVAVAFITGFLFCQNDLVADQLEDAYKEQYERYTAEIEQLQKSIKLNEDIFVRFGSLYKETCVPYDYNLHDGCKGILDDMKIPAKQLEKNRPRLKELEGKKQDLKIKILETKGTLPEWWTK